MRDGAADQREQLKWLGEAAACFVSGNYAEAVDILQEALGIDPGHAVARHKLGAALCHLGRYQEAEEEFRRATKLDPGFAHPHFNLGVLLLWKREYAAAEAALRRAVELDPGNAEAHANLGTVLGARNRVSDARDCFESAVRLNPRSVSALCGLAWAAGVEGRFEEVERLYRSVLEIDPRKSDAWAGLAELRRMTTADDEWLESVQRLIAAGVAAREEVGLRYALGKYFNDIGSYPEAFAHYRRANELHKLSAKPYDRTARTTFVDERVGVYTRQRMACPVEGASASARPVLVVGMMRSGTSLAEQIIASHPKAAGAGELDFWNEATYEHRDVLRRDLPDGRLAKKLVDSYLDTLARHSADALRVVDKSNVNSDHLGLIHALFPNARIIYLWRDPVDTCLSCYFQHFAHAPSFTMDLFDLAHYYREHHRLIGHWRSVLPLEALLIVPYAELVRDQQAWSRRLIEFIGLEWDPRCLEFHKTARPVLTASNWQVRQPVYSRSIERWRNYQKHIEPLLRLRELKSP